MPETHSPGSISGHEGTHEGPVYRIEEDDDPRTRLVRERMEKAKEEFVKDSAEFEWWSDERYGDLFRSMWPREFDEIVPKEVLKHVRRAQHEALLAFRELLNYWIDRTAAEKTTPGDKPGHSGPITIEGKGP